MGGFAYKHNWGLKFFWGFWTQSQILHWNTQGQHVAFKATASYPWAVGVNPTKWCSCFKESETRCYLQTKLHLLGIPVSIRGLPHALPWNIKSHSQHWSSLGQELQHRIKSCNRVCTLRNWIKYLMRTVEWYPFKISFFILKQRWRKKPAFDVSHLVLGRHPYVISPPPQIFCMRKRLHCQNDLEIILLRTRIYFISKGQLPTRYRLIYF